MADVLPQTPTTPSIPPPNLSYLDPQPTSTSPSTKDPILNAHITSLRLLFTAWLTHFRTLGYIKESTMDHLDKTVLRKILTLSVRDPRAREALGNSVPVWTDMLELLRVAVPSLESRSYGTIPTEYDTAADGTTTASGAVYDAPAADVIVQHYATLLRDLQRLNNILCIARNVLTAGTAVQNLAARLSVDREVCCLVNLCVKTTARGYDGNGTTADEERWQAVVNEYKKLLITCLQFLSNLVTLNERLKLMLWVELFDGSSEGNVPGWHDPAGAVRPGFVNSKSGGKDEEEGDDAWVANATGKLLSGKEDAIEEFFEGKTGEESSRVAELASGAKLLLSGRSRSRTPSRSRSRTSVRRKSSGAQRKRSPRPPTVYLLWLYEQKDRIREDLRGELGGVEPTMRQVLSRATDDWEVMAEDKKVRFQTARSKELDQWHRELKTWKRDVRSWMATHGIDFDVDENLQDFATQDRLCDILSEMAEAADAADGLRDPSYLEQETQRPSQIVTRMYESQAPPLHPSKGTMETADDGIRKLEEGKRGLLKRLEDNAALAAPPQMNGHSQPVPLGQGGDAVSPTSPVESIHSATDGQAEQLPPEEEEEADEELEPEEEEGDLESEEVDDESSEDEYDRIPGEEGRGLLTDVPLILGPNEIEVLPMIIMSGIVTESSQVKQKQAESTNEQLQVFLNMYTIRCHLLLAQENGRNLLRELLIFVAAWDLREEELYFKFMVKIMESILLHGLMPFAYQAFKESKDIISPAQAVIMKLLTKIFHARGAFVHSPDSIHPPGAATHPATGWGDEATVVMPGNHPKFVSPIKARDSGQPEHAVSSPESESAPNPGATLTNNDPTRTIVSTLFSEFRSNIIPQICALIFLQGEIRGGHASIEDFPLNLWDMERMYEGVYQYLEFFAILTDHDDWKELMASWEVVSELVTLLRELDTGIGKSPRQRATAAAAAAAAFNHNRQIAERELKEQEEMAELAESYQEWKDSSKKWDFDNEAERKDHEDLVAQFSKKVEQAEANLKRMRAEGKVPSDESGSVHELGPAGRKAYLDAKGHGLPNSMALAAARAQADEARVRATPHYDEEGQEKPPVAVDRPYSPLPEAPSNTPGHAAANAQQRTQAKDVATPASPTSTTPSPSVTPPATAGNANGTANPPLHEEPADFEWRNLKKLCVLVLSSLVWRNTALQDQVLRFGGVDVLLRCCVHDEHNPYIREHAIMCLRFLVEGNEHVRRRVRFLDAVARKARVWEMVEARRRRGLLPYPPNKVPKPVPTEYTTSGQEEEADQESQPLPYNEPLDAMYDAAGTFIPNIYLRPDLPTLASEVEDEDLSRLRSYSTNASGTSNLHSAVSHASVSSASASVEDEASEDPSRNNSTTSATFDNAPPKSDDPDTYTPTQWNALRWSYWADVDPADDVAVSRYAARHEIIPVPREVLDQSGYETYMDQKGVVGLRRKGIASATATAEHKTRMSLRSGWGKGPAAGQGVEEYLVERNEAADFEEEYGPSGSQASLDDDDRSSGNISEDYLDDEDQHENGDVSYDEDDIIGSGDEQFLSAHSAGEGEASESAIPRASQRPRAAAEDVEKATPAEWDARAEALSKHLSKANEHVGKGEVEKPRTAADLPAWVERITRDLPYKRVARERERQRAMAGAAEGEA